MFRKNFIANQGKGVAKEIRKSFANVIESFELDLRVQTANRQQNLQKMEVELKKMSHQIRDFSNLLLQDDFTFSSFEDHPLVLTNYCQIMFSILTNSLKEQTQKRRLWESQKIHSQNNIYEVVAAIKLENFDLKQKIDALQNQLHLSKQRAECAQQISTKLKEEAEQFLERSKQNMGLVCDLLKKAQNAQIELLQNNRFLKEQLQSLSIQFQRYKEYFKQGPSLKEKEFKMKTQMEREYQKRLQNAIKQVETTIRGQLQRSVLEKFNLKDIRQLRF